MALQTLKFVLNVNLSPFNLQHHDFGELRKEAHDSGYRFIEKLVSRWNEGSDRFGLRGEIFLGVFENEQLLGIGGLNQDPYGLPEVGRLRHVFVRPTFRQIGVGRIIVNALVKHAQVNFPRVRLNAADQDAAGFYEKLGFSPTCEENATHDWDFARGA